MNGPNRRAVFWGGTLLCIAMALDPGICIAAEAGTAPVQGETDREAQNEAQDKPQEKTPQTAAAKPGGNSEVFVPTEEISEDFSVSFPVDI